MGTTPVSQLPSPKPPTNLQFSTNRSLPSRPATLFRDSGRPDARQYDLGSEEECRLTSTSMPTDTTHAHEIAASGGWDSFWTLGTSLLPTTQNGVSASYDPHSSLLLPTTASLSINTGGLATISSSFILTPTALVSGSPTLSTALNKSPSPRIKMEHPEDEIDDFDDMAYSAVPSSQSYIAGGTGGYATADGYEGPSRWQGAQPKMEDQGLDVSDPTFMDAFPGPEGDSTADHDQSAGPSRPQRSQRRLTTTEEANFKCAVKGCGKLFSRSYNYKAHMETHDENRAYPFHCPVNNCDKKFVRKTDLQRHHQSVHAKEKNYGCDYCGRLFARKDTLRRHMEDGCARRFDLGTVDLRTTNYDPMGTYGGRLPEDAYNIEQPLPLPSMVLPGGPNAPEEAYDAAEAAQQAGQRSNAQWQRR